MFTTFDAPGAVTGTGFLNGTQFVCCISPTGAVVGIFFDAQSAGHGFLRAPNGTFTAFDPSGSIFTFPTGINPQGAISGAYTDASGATHGFLRAPDGTITTFDPPGSVAPFGTEPVAISPRGTIVGSSAGQDIFHGFLRAADSTFTTFDPPGSAETFPNAINPAETIPGLYGDANGVTHGFVFLPRP
jgi:hypothetical protein